MELEKYYKIDHKLLDLFYYVDKIQKREQE